MLASVTFHKAEKYAVDMKLLEESTKEFLMKNFGCSRKVYNLYVGLLYDALEQAGYRKGDEIPEVKLPEVTGFKKQYPFLKEADSLGLANAKQDFQGALNHFKSECDHVSYTKRALRRDASGTEPLSFRGLKGMPKFHAKACGYFSYTTNCQYPGKGNSLVRPTIRLEGSTLYIPKLHNGIRLVVHRGLPDDAVIGNVTLSMDADIIYASIEYSYTIQMEMSLREAAQADDTSVLDGLAFLGLDYSNPDFYVDSEGRKANYPSYYRKSEEKLAKLQHALARMEKDSANYNRQMAKIRKLHVKIKNQRRDFLQKLSTELVRTYDVIVVEDIDLRAMGGALSLGKNLHDNGFGMFRNMVSYKLDRKGSVLVKVARKFPSTKKCGNCGYINKEVILGVKEWDCPACGTHHLRDENAARNIRDEGKRIFLSYFREQMKEQADAAARSANLKAARKRKAA